MKRITVLALLIFCVSTSFSQDNWRRIRRIDTDTIRPYKTGDTVQMVGTFRLNGQTIASIDTSVVYYSRHQVDSIFQSLLNGFTMSAGSMITFTDDASPYSVQLGNEELTTNRTVSLPNKDGPLMSRADTAGIVYSRHKTDSIAALKIKYSDTLTTIETKHRADSVSELIYSYQTFHTFKNSTGIGTNSYNSFSTDALNSTWLGADYQRLVVPQAMTLSRLFVYVNSASTGTDMAVTINKNGSATTLTVPVVTGAYSAGAGTFWADTTHSVPFYVGDAMSVYVRGNGGVATNIVISALATYRK